MIEHIPMRHNSGPHIYKSNLLEELGETVLFS